MPFSMIACGNYSYFLARVLAMSTFSNFTSSLQWVMLTNHYTAVDATQFLFPLNVFKMMRRCFPVGPMKCGPS